MLEANLVRDSARKRFSLSASLIKLTEFWSRFLRPSYSILSSPSSPGVRQASSMLETVYVGDQLINVTNINRNVTNISVVLKNRVNRSLSIHTYYFVTNFESGHKSCSKFINFRHNLLVNSNGLSILFSYHPVLSMTWKTYVSLLLCNPSNGPSEPFRKFLPRWYDQSLGRTSFGENEAFWELLMSYYRKLVIKGGLNCGSPGCPWLWISPWLITSIAIQEFRCSEFQCSLFNELTPELLIF